MVAGVGDPAGTSAVHWHSAVYAAKSAAGVLNFGFAAPILGVGDSPIKFFALLSFKKVTVFPKNT